MKTSYSLASLSYRFFGKMADNFAERFSLYNDTIYIKSGIPLYFNAYIAQSIFISVITFILIILILLPINLRFYNVTIAIISSILFGIAGSGIAIISMVTYPIHKVTSEARIINSKLLDTIIFMASLAQADSNVDHIMNTIAETIEIKQFKRIFYQYIKCRNMLGMDSVTALKEARKMSPSQTLASILDGLSSIALTSGNLKDFLVSESYRLLEDKRNRLKKLIGNLSLLSEAYISLMVVMPTILIIILSFISILGGSIGGLPSEILIGLLIFVFVPFSSLGLMIIIDMFLSEV